MRLLAGLYASLCCAAALAQTPAAPLPPSEERIYQDILKAAAEPDRDVRAQVAIVTSLIGRKDALPTLRRLLADPAPVVRIAALRALPSLLPAGSQAPFEVEPPVEDAFLRAALLTAAAQYTFKGRDALVAAALDHGSPSDKELALRALGLDKTAKALEVLLKALEDANPRIRAAALAGLGLMPQPQAAEAAAKALADPSFLVRAAACQSLAAARAEG
ncbi:MAG TPA: HEAT repeat domain-containing protein, partial [Candidatus Brocadiia bacterium]|nr:HEAT repeat domain-containing protein [Candidatus Brocadiia bacterium]